MEYTLTMKEEISNLKFPNTDVLNTPDEIKNRKYDLDRAMSLGNLDQVKMKIYFEDDESPKVVDTTVWATTESSVVLKSGTYIPIRRIYKIV